jgi:UDP-N-acetylglucosamine/UDP-N-acetylgalactosamine diphosphorylase
MLAERLRELGQDHIARLLEGEADPSRRALIERDLAGVDLDLVSRLMRGESLYTPPGGDVEPADIIPASFASSTEAGEAVSRGNDLLASGRVAAVIVAGGQGSRLGIDAPKGFVEVTPVRGKSLFCLFAEKILALKRRFGHAVPLFVMTSRENDAPTRTYFQEKGFFGLGDQNVHFFVQGVLPSVSPEGRFILSEAGGVFMNPDGHGGTFRALRDNGCLDLMASAGIEEIFYFQVDNPLVKVCDPLFIGLHNTRGAQMSTKVVRKASFDERVGVIAKQGGRTCMLEYSDMSDEVRRATDPQGRMLFWAGNMAVHMIRRDFAETVTSRGAELPYHRAAKKIVGLDAAGNPTRIDGIKFESFLFDALPLACRSVTLEVVREEEFAPVKNMTGTDSLESSRRIQSNLHASWLGRIGVDVPAGVLVEISPLFALDFEELQRKQDRIPRSIQEDTYVG